MLYPAVFTRICYRMCVPVFVTRLRFIPVSGTRLRFIPVSGTRLCKYHCLCTRLCNTTVCVPGCVYPCLLVPDSVYPDIGDFVDQRCHGGFVISVAPLGASLGNIAVLTKRCFYDKQWSRCRKWRFYDKQWSRWLNSVDLRFRRLRAAF